MSDRRLSQLAVPPAELISPFPFSGTNVTQKDVSQYYFVRKGTGHEITFTLNKGPFYQYSDALKIKIHFAVFFANL